MPPLCESTLYTSIADICTAAAWATPNTFSRFYNLRVEPMSSRVLASGDQWHRDLLCVNHGCCVIPLYGALLLLLISVPLGEPCWSSSRTLDSRAWRSARRQVQHSYECPRSALVLHVCSDSPLGDPTCVFIHVMAPIMVSPFLWTDLHQKNWCAFARALLLYRHCRAGCAWRITNANCHWLVLLTLKGDWALERDPTTSVTLTLRLCSLLQGMRVTYVAETFSLVFLSCLVLMWWVMNSFEKNSLREHRWKCQGKIRKVLD